ncbi:Integrase / recombinase [Liberibacter crescens BT-1]|uniref:Integrase / recombinase n=1 Tax=Liberibacter crescens (strain BT-1) TaxID=1215343 RepID=L0EWZ8_LIBCB|nr:tyrosine-type recombinase/integrase [Liberibacter crescens]AGA64901.1 Integrase / recombinase [Liberibacter crescens BT-1]AMC12930.1 integrase [Liberibacter crescens]
MPKHRYPHLSHETTRHGKKVWYFKKNGKRIRLPDSYGSQKFLEAYKNALAGNIPVKRNTVKQGTLAWLIQEYGKSSHYRSLNISTKKVRENIYKKIIQNSGDIPFTQITRKHIQDTVDKRAATPFSAIGFLKAISPIFKWALENEFMSKNPVIGISRPSQKTDGFYTWTVEEVEKYRSFHPVGTKARLALELMLFLGLRRSDVVRIGPQHMKDGVLSIKTQKTGTWVYIPVFKPLQECIEKTETGNDTFLTTHKGTSFMSSSSFGNWFCKKCRQAGLADECRAHGLRKAGATIAANAGASTQELMAMFGWSKMSMAEVYTKAADKTRLAYQAAKKLSKGI